MTSNKKNHEYPQYLSMEFLKASLENGLQKSGIEIESLNLTMGSSAGDNYCSEIYRAMVSYRESNISTIHEISLIIKSISHNQIRNVIFELDFPNKERIVYQEVIPKMQSLIPGTNFAPKLYHTIKNPIVTFVFEDLRQHGFILASRQHGLNEYECKMVLERLGQFHACSMHLLQKDPKTFDYPGFHYGLFRPECMDDPLMESFFVDSLKTEISIVETWPGYENYAIKLKKIYANVKQRLLDVVAPVEGEIRVLSHGDLWVNNFMFKYEDEAKSGPMDFRFLDFQASFISSPGIDLNYFFNTSVQYEVLVDRRDQLVEYYYNSLMSTLKALNYIGIPSLDQIKAEILRKEFYGFMSAVSILPVICIDESLSADCNFELFSDKDAGERKRLLACKSKRFQQLMKYMLKRYDGLGVLD